MQEQAQYDTEQYSLEGPSNIDAERSVLGSVLLENGIIPEVMQELPSPDMFYLSAHQMIYSGILELVTEGISADLTLLSDRLKKTGKLDAVGGYFVLADLEQFVVATSSAVEHAHLVRTAHEHRMLLRVCNSGARQAKLAVCEPREIVEQTCKEFMAVVDSNHDRSRYTPMNELMEIGVDSAFAAAQRRRRGEILGVPMGLSDLDRLTGGLQAGEVTIVAARPSIGKTSLAMHTYRHAISKLKKRVVFFSLEMGNEPIANRIICAEARLDADRIRKGWASDADLERHRQAATDLSGAPGLVRDCSQLSGIELLMQVRLLKAQYPDLALVIIDGLWLMEHPQGRGLNYATMVGETSRLVKRAAKESGIPIMLLHQLSRHNEMRAGSRDRHAGRGDRPTLSDLRDSGAVEQDADLVIFIYRERREQQQADEDPVDAGAQDPDRNDLDDEPDSYERSATGQRVFDQLVPTELIVAKHRNGPIGTANALFNTSTQQWLDQQRG